MSDSNAELEARADRLIEAKAALDNRLTWHFWCKDMQRTPAFRAYRRRNPPGLAVKSGGFVTAAK